ncbi:hypothetical protein AAES_43712 [Amazona aestiva]|uniref:Uncharacterized protein n=1 Tax=Amazona aestiva TaxID=12930 RepID=A0A0Q3QB96_AMAAE|nr:hypothetical protein AAES_43712 [Amazona aestiva]
MRPFLVADPSFKLVGKQQKKPPEVFLSPGEFQQFEMWFGANLSGKSEVFVDNFSFMMSKDVDPSSGVLHQLSSSYRSLNDILVIMPREAIKPPQTPGAFTQLEQCPMGANLTLVTINMPLERFPWKESDWTSPGQQPVSPEGCDALWA